MLKLFHLPDVAFSALLVVPFDILLFVTDSVFAFWCDRLFQEVVYTFCFFEKKKECCWLCLDRKETLGNLKYEYDWVSAVLVYDSNAMTITAGWVAGEGPTGMNGKGLNQEVTTDTKF